MDAKDRIILEQLQRDSSQATRDIAKKTRIPVTTVHNRIKKMRERNIITTYTVHVDYDQLGLPIEALILVSVAYTGKQHDQEGVAKTIKKLGAHEVLIVTGDEDILVRVRASNVSDLNNFVTKKLRTVPGVDKTKTLLVLSRH